jgi:hypothetical protein
MARLVNMKTTLSLTLLLALAQSLPAEDQTTAVIRNGDKPAFEYRHDTAAFKPYVVQLYTPSGVAILRDNVDDHKHHHGLMFAVAADSVDFWSEMEKCGRQVERQFSTNVTGIAQQLDWTSSDRIFILRENRTVRLETEAGVTLLTWRTQLTTPPGKETVNLTGSHYFGLGARFIPILDKVGTFLNSGNTTGTVVRGTEKVTPANWCAYTAAVGDKPVTFAMFDHPSNPRSPSQMFTMLQPFSYLSATLNLWKQPLLLKAGEPLDLRYGVALWDGQPSHDEIEKLYQHWLKTTRRP